MKKIIPFAKEIEFKTMISKVTSISLEHTLKIADQNCINGFFIVAGTYKMTQASQIDEEFSYKIPVEIEIDPKYETDQVTIEIDDFTYEVIDEERMKLNISLCMDHLEEKIQSDIEKDLETNSNSLIELPENPELANIECRDQEHAEKEEVITLEENIEEEVPKEILDDLFLPLSQEKELEIAHPLEDTTKYPSISNTFTIPDSHPSKISSDDLSETKEMDINTMDGVNSLFASFKDSVETFKTYSVYIVKPEDTIDSILSKYNVTREELEEYNNLSDVKSGSKVIVPNAKNEQN